MHDEDLRNVKSDPLVQVSLHSLYLRIVNVTNCILSWLQRLQQHTLFNQVNVSAATPTDKGRGPHRRRQPLRWGDVAVHVISPRQEPRAPAGDGAATTAIRNFDEETLAGSAGRDVETGLDSEEQVRRTLLADVERLKTAYAANHHHHHLASEAGQVSLTYRSARLAPVLRNGGFPSQDSAGMHAQNAKVHVLPDRPPPPPPPRTPTSEGGARLVISSGALHTAGVAVCCANFDWFSTACLTANETRGNSNLSSFSTTHCRGFQVSAWLHCGKG
jgi:hypothetical protein